MIDLDALEELAKVTTALDPGGSYRAEPGDPDASWQDWHVMLDHGAEPAQMAECFFERDARFFAAANPAVVLALIARIRESEQESADAWEIAKLNGAEGRRESERAERYRESLEAIAKPYPLGPTNALNSALNMQDTARNVLRDGAPTR